MTAALRRHGFLIVLAAIVLFFALATRTFATLDNLMGLLHAAAPLAIVASGLALVVIAGRLDISVGSIAFLSGAIAAMAMSRTGLDPWLATALAILVGALLGALNGLIVVVLRVNALITTLGTMIALRGIGLQLTESRVFALPEPMRVLGNLKLGPVFVDVLVAAAVLVLVHVLHTRHRFGRHLTAIGNGDETAQRLGLPVDRLVFLAFVLSGALAAAGGMMSSVQVGSVTPMLGQGMEFTAVAVIVIGGISLFGGRGAILPGLLLGVLLLEAVRNGLNHLGADPFAYRFVNGAVIFVAMWADSLRHRRAVA
jgi:ribose/xylose/arabinose/galactoside ABC-type transport system permease subunit